MATRLVQIAMNAVDDSAFAPDHRVPGKTIIRVTQGG
jgi:hypothetical protein